MTAIREADGDDLAAAMNVLDAALLDVDAGAVRSRIRDGGVLVAAEGDRVLGALVLDGREIEAVAVRPGRRGQGIGTALVEAAAERVDGALTAAFDPRLRPFYGSLGFDVEPAGDGRCRGIRRAGSDKG